jgi:major type 1 subunit fimbrin (pilin)
MMRTAISSFVFACSFMSGIASAAVTVEGGRVDFKGELVVAACAVDVSSVDQTINLGQVRTAALDKVGATSAAADFSINLTDCDPSVTTSTETPGVPGTVAVGFYGVQKDGYGEPALAITGAGAASGIAIVIKDKTGKAVALDGKAGEKNTLQSGVHSLPFQASYVRTGDLTAGTANATATFSLTYE